MAYDDTPYWQRNKEPVEDIKPSIKPEASNSPKATRSIPWSSQVAIESERCKRGARVSPLLEEWLRLKGLPVV